MEIKQRKPAVCFHGKQLHQLYCHRQRGNQQFHGGNGKSACIKAEQFYYFHKDKIKYKVIGKLDEEIFNLLVEFIEELNKSGMQFQQIMVNV